MRADLGQRVAFIDVAKTICIMLMVIGHWTKDDTVFTYIYSFHMPALFVISGFLYRPHSWRMTLMAFAFPYFFFSMISLVVKLFLGELQIVELADPRFVFRIIHYRYGLETGLFTGDWFLWALIGLRFMFGDISWLHYTRKFYLYLAIVATVYMTFEKHLISIDSLFRGYYIGRLVPCLPFFCLGLFLRKMDWKPCQVPRICIVMMFVSFLLIPTINHALGIYDNSYGYSYLLYAANAMLVSVFVFVISDMVPTSKYIITLSKGTLVILGLHSPLLHILDRILPSDINILSPFITMLLCYYAILVCERYFPMLLGKVRK
jgi:fucose 4-O-acetylase-like acetyltransferase